LILLPAPLLFSSSASSSTLTFAGEMMISLNDSLHQDWKVREAREASASARYGVTVERLGNRHSAYLWDRSTSRCVDVYAAESYGAMFYLLALEHAKLLNKGK